ncbi:MAG: hypothetical protein BM564_07615 [Bacteroidetes bacterium MedPE-SWsnd-G2]|nr:MAG: hypothetical protein BM564_07615 [Bacteroidetes bacterium MedPE-SWsnd-G2]
MLIDDWFSDLDLALEQNKPTVCYRHPNESVLKRFIQKDDQLNYSKNLNESGFVFNPFDSEKEAILFDEKKCAFHEIEFVNEEVDVTELNNDSSVSSENSNAHMALVNKGIEAIKSNQFKKVVLSRVEAVNRADKTPIEQFKLLLKLYPSAFVYIWFHPKVGLWIGATPETLLQVKDRQFSTMALAGTQKYNGSLNVNWTDKEREEQAIVTRVIKENCEPYCSNLNVGTVETVQAANLVHLKTKISGLLKQSDDFKGLIKQLHPTPAVCGYPLENSKAFILENEGYDREFYTGFLGELNRNSLKTRNRNPRNVENNVYQRKVKGTKLYVNLRCAQLKGDKALIYVGGGITIDSNAETEWEETVNKSQTMIKALI